MIRARGAILVAAVAVSACHASAPEGAGGGAGRVDDFGLDADAFHVDRIGASDGSLDPDGVPDAVFHATVEGPANGVVLLVLDAHGKPIGQWDTLTSGDVLAPPGGGDDGLLSSHGDSTYGLALYENGARLNHNDGSVSPLGPGPHRLELVAEVRDVEGARSAQLVVQLADGTLVRGPTTPLTVPRVAPAPSAAPASPAPSAAPSSVPPASSSAAPASPPPAGSTGASAAPPGTSAPLRP